MYRSADVRENTWLWNAVGVGLALALTGLVGFIRSAWIAAVTPGLALALAVFVLVCLGTGRTATWGKRALVLAAIAAALTGAVHLTRPAWPQDLAAWAHKQERIVNIYRGRGKDGLPLLATQNLSRAGLPFRALRNWQNLQPLLPASVALAGWPATILAAALALRRRRSWATSPEEEEIRDRQERRTPPRERDGCLLGRGTDGKNCVITGRALETHGIVTGKTGSGKTNTLLLFAAAFAHSHTLVLVDGKGDPGFINALETIARGAGKPFAVWTCTGPAHWDPLASGSPSELTDKIMELFEWSEPYYEDVGRRYLLTVFSAAARDGVTLDLTRLAELMDPDCALDSLSSLRDNTWLRSLDAKARRDLAGLAARIEVLRLSDLGPWLSPPASGGPALDLTEAAARGTIVLISLDSDRFGTTASLAGRMWVQELRILCNRRKTAPGGPRVLAVLDEFVSYPTPATGQLYAQARSAGVSLVLASQGYQDFRLVNEELLEQVIQNANVHVIHTQPSPKNAQLAADLCGTKKTWEHTFQTERASHTGRGSLRRVHEYKFHPDVFKSLPKGEAVVLCHDPAFATRVRVRRFEPPTKGGE